MDMKKLEHIKEVLNEALEGRMKLTKEDSTPESKSYMDGYIQALMWVCGKREGKWASKGLK